MNTPECDKWAKQTAFGPECAAFLEWLSAQGVTLMRYEKRPGTPCPHKEKSRTAMMDLRLICQNDDLSDDACPECGESIFHGRARHGWVEPPFEGYVPTPRDALIAEYLGVDLVAREKELRAIIDGLRCLP